MQSEKEWGQVLLLDQDSVSTPNMVERLLPFCSQSVGIVAPIVLDRNRGMDTKDTSNDPTISVQTAARKGVITSGSLTSLQAWKAAGRFDESLFIDYVDYDFNERLLLNHFKILRVTSAFLIQETGHAQQTCFWTPRKESNGRWKLERFYSFGHSPMRCYYKARNRVIFSRKYAPYVWNKFEGIYQVPVQILLTLLFEDQKKEKLRMFIRGFAAGCSASVRKYRPVNFNNIAQDA